MNSSIVVHVLFCPTFAISFRIGTVEVELAAGEEEVGGGAAQTGC